MRTLGTAPRLEAESLRGQLRLFRAVVLACSSICDRHEAARECCRAALVTLKRLDECSGSLLLALPADQHAAEP